MTAFTFLSLLDSFPPSIPSVSSQESTHPFNHTTDLVMTWDIEIENFKSLHKTYLYQIISSITQIPAHQLFFKSHKLL